MNLVIEKAAFFRWDFEERFAYYVDEADEDVARRFQVSLDISLVKLSQQPSLGRVRHFRSSKLRGLRSFSVERPFNKVLIFYRTDGGFLHAIRLIHGARDLPRRLLQTPGTN